MHEAAALSAPPVSKLYRSPPAALTSSVAIRLLPAYAAPCTLGGAERLPRLRLRWRGMLRVNAVCEDLTIPLYQHTMPYHGHAIPCTPSGMQQHAPASTLLCYLHLQMHFGPQALWHALQPSRGRSVHRPPYNTRGHVLALPAANAWHAMAPCKACMHARLVAPSGGALLWPNLYIIS